MANFLNYLEKNQKSFTEKAFNIIDSLILAYLSYLHFPNTKTKLKDLSVLKSAKTKKNKEFIKRVIASKRYKDVELCFYVEDTNDLIEKQFSAVTFLLPDNTMYISKSEHKNRHFFSISIHLAKKCYSCTSVNRLIML